MEFLTCLLCPLCLQRFLLGCYQIPRVQGDLENLGIFEVQDFRLAGCAGRTVVGLATDCSAKAFQTMMVLVSYVGMPRRQDRSRQLSLGAAVLGYDAKLSWIVSHSRYSAGLFAGLVGRC